MIHQMNTYNIVSILIKVSGGGLACFMRFDFLRFDFLRFTLLHVYLDLVFFRIYNNIYILVLILHSITYPLFSLGFLFFSLMNVKLIKFLNEVIPKPSLSSSISTIYLQFSIFS